MNYLSMRTKRFCRRILQGLIVLVLVFFLKGILSTGNARKSQNPGILSPGNTKDSQNPELDAKCAATLGSTQQENVQKIQSYKFPGTDKYTDLKFTKVKEDKLPEYPIMVTALSSNHFIEGLKLVDNLDATIRKKYPSVDLVMFDIGLSASQKQQMASKCNCIVRQFPFDMFPGHVRILSGFAFKPLAIQLVAIYHPFVFWVDTSARFTTSDLGPVFSQARAVGVMAGEGNESLAVRTWNTTFQFLKEEACAFRHTNEFEPGFSLFYATEFVIKNLLYPWVMCALSPDCMVPVHLNPSQYPSCSGKPVYHLCHRFDQSVFSILLHRLYGTAISEHRMNHTFYKICKNGQVAPFLPQFFNEIIIEHTETCY